MRKIIKIMVLCLVAGAFIICTYLGMSSKLLDFRGAVTEIEVVDGNTVFRVSQFETTYTVVANHKTNVSYCCKNDPEIALSDIKVGDTIEGNYRWLSKNNVARFITVEYHN